MDWKVALDVATSIVSVVALVVSIYAIIDARKKAHEAIVLQRNLAWSKALSETMWLFIDRTEKAHTPEVADATYQCFLLMDAADPGKWTQGDLKEAVDNESLQSAEEMVRAGYARWKEGFLLEKGEARLRRWKSDKNRERIRILLGRKPEDRLS
jgi:hypothetical protein